MACAEQGPKGVSGGGRRLGGVGSMGAGREKGQGVLRDAADVGTRADGCWEPGKEGERAPGRSEWPARLVIRRLGPLPWPPLAFAYTPGTRTRLCLSHPPRSQPPGSALAVRCPGPVRPPGGGASSCLRPRPVPAAAPRASQAAGRPGPGPCSVLCAPSRGPALPLGSPRPGWPSGLTRNPRGPGRPEGRRDPQPPGPAAELPLRFRARRLLETSHAATSGGFAHPGGVRLTYFHVRPRHGARHHREVMGG